MGTAEKTTAAIVVVGNEILSGKVLDSNSHLAAKALREAGVWLKRILVVPDEITEIAEAVAECHSQYSIVITSGGVGPTHDDVTIAGVARGLGLRVVKHPVIEERLRSFYKSRINSARLKMAEVPEGAKLTEGGSFSFPTVKVANVYILPGIPEIFAEKLEAIKQQVVTSPFYLKVVYTREGEGAIAEYLSRTLEQFPGLEIGSYPKLGDPEYAVKVTLEGKDREYVERAFAHLLEWLPQHSVVRTEG